MDCHRVKRLIILYTDNELDRDLLISFQRHVRSCPGCGWEVIAAQRLKALVGRCPRESAPPTLREKILASLRHLSH